MNKNPVEKAIKRLAQAAWDVRESAYVLGTTKVGCAVLSADGPIFAGCNVEHQFRSHDVHAEVNAIASMVSAGQHKLVAVVVVADRDYFTPCGACMDWIMQFGNEKTLIAFQREKGGETLIFTAKEIMPHYPR